MKLNDLVENIFRLDAQKRKGLAKLGIKIAHDLLYYFPARYEKISGEKDVYLAVKGDLIIARGVVSKIGMVKTRKRMGLVEAKIKDENGSAVKALWFNQPYVAKMLKEGDEVVLTGKISKNKKGEPYFSNPVFNKTYYGADRVNETEADKTIFYENLETVLNKNKQEREAVSAAEEDTNKFVSVYPETRGLTSKWLRFAIFRILKNLDDNEFIDPLPLPILKKYHLPNLKNSLLYLHNPKSIKNSEAAKKRFSFQEIFLIQLQRIKDRAIRNSKPCFKVEVDYDELKEFIDELPFTLTGAQKKAIFRIVEDFKKKEPMSRLLHGDVGSGKTIVALAACFIIVKNGYQAVYMVPTEILARQHFETFIKFLPEDIKMGLLTSSICEKFPSKVNLNNSVHVSKARLKKWAMDGEIKILIGTHSLIQKEIQFKNAALAVIDEQHRFGVSQRLKIVRKNEERIPHFLSMTATPIPRTLALTVYGDLDLTLLDEMPAGRKEVMTYIVPPSERYRAYEQIREEIKNGRQAYIICPRIEAEEIEESGIKSGTAEDRKEMKAVKKEWKKLSQEVYPEFKIEMLHGKMKPKEKEKIMSEFKSGDIKILVSTSVIEVGIDIENANCILIEGASRFGLAQLHQLRGRVLRSSYQAHCFVLSETNSVNILKRLAALKQAKNGFELAEYDLKFRGAGGLSGKKQWGLTDIGMEALKNIKMVEAARLEAAELLKNDFELKKYPLLKEKMEKYKEELHWE